MNITDGPCIISLLGEAFSNEEHVALCAIAAAHLRRLEADTTEDVTLKFENPMLSGRITYKGPFSLHMIRGHQFFVDLGLHKGERREATFILPDGAHPEQFAGPVRLMRIRARKEAPTQH